MGVREQILIEDRSFVRVVFVATGPVENYERVCANGDIRDCGTGQFGLAPAESPEVLCYGGCPQHLCTRCGSCKV